MRQGLQDRVVEPELSRNVLTVPGAGFETLQVRLQEDVVRVTLDRAQRQNSINSVMIDELHAALDLAERSAQCRIVVLEGTSGVFCTGMDFGEATPSDDADEEEVSRGGEAFFGLLKRFTTIPRAVVARVDGRVTGGGVGVAAASDFVYASPRSTFNLPEALWGLLPCCVLPFLIRRVGFQAAYAMTLSTLPVRAEKAQSLQLVDEVSDDTGALVRRMRARLTKLDAETIGEVKRYLGRMWSVSDEMERTAVSEFTRLMASPVVRDRISGFATRQFFPWETR